VKQYKVTVNGKTYEVEVDEIGSAPAVSAVKEVLPEVAAAPAPAASIAKAPTAGAAVVSSPMPGTVIKIIIKAGDAVKSGDAVLILEAMKMENEIAAPKDGILDVVAVSKGAAVNAGDLLFSIK